MVASVAMKLSIVAMSGAIIPSLGDPGDLHRHPSMSASA